MENSLVKSSIFESMQLKKQEQEVAQLIAFNSKSSRFGLELTREEAYELVECRNQSLRSYQRAEFGKGILEALMFEFCDSQYIDGDNYLEILESLQDTFYLFRNETQDKMTDEEILHFMKEQFETVCAGDAKHLADTCLERMAKAVRSGYRGYEEKDGRNIYEEVDEEERWSPELYFQVLKELTWE